LARNPFLLIRGPPAQPPLPAGPRARVYTMKILHLNQVLQHAPAVAAMIVCCSMTILAFLFEQRLQQERASLHASADATQFQHTLQQGVDSYIHMNRGLAAHFTASPPHGGSSFATYMKAVDVLRQNPGLSYIGYVERTGRKEQPHEEPVRDGTQAPDQAFAYPYLYAYPGDAHSNRARGVDFSTIPQRWLAMQQARDSGQSTATAKHSYVAGSTAVPIIIVFTPIYDPALPRSTVAQRRAALRGFVFSIYQIEEMIERMMGHHFHQLFDLEIYDGAVRAETILYDGDRRSHVLMHDADMPIARQAKVEVAEREWQLFFYPKPVYV
jgi:CHASE1-domain containing sensor protein